jgi:hypothetical protein
MAESSRVGEPDMHVGLVGRESHGVHEEQSLQVLYRLAGRRECPMPGSQKVVPTASRDVVQGPRSGVPAASSTLAVG